MPQKTPGLRREIEPRWVSEYVFETYSQHRHAFRVPLGPIPQNMTDMYGAAKARKVFRPSRPEIDAVVWTEKYLILVEGKIYKVMDGLAKLPVYASLVPTTAELANDLDKQIRMELLCVNPLPWIEEAAEKAGVAVIRFTPPWILEIWEDRDRYWTPEAIAKREEKKRILRSLGID